jgi:hypothetical protein
MQDWSAIVPNSKGWDAARRPQHYARLQPEPIEVIECWQLGYFPGNILKYLVRAGHKGPDGKFIEEFNREYAIKDLRKAQYYLERYIKNVTERPIRAPEDDRQ